MGEQSPLEPRWFPDAVEPGDEEPCVRCGATPTRINEYMRVMSFLVLTRHATYQARLCRGCATRQGLTELGKSALLGWWGIPWGLLTFVAIFKDVRSLFRWSTLPKAAVLLLGLLPFVLLAGVGAWFMRDEMRAKEAKQTGDWGSKEIAQLVDQGHEKVNEGKPEEALALYLKAHEGAPNSSVVNYSLATTQVSLGDLRQALHYAARAEELAPKRLGYAALHGWLLQRTGDTDAARAKAKAIAGRDPEDSADAHWTMTLLYELEDWPALEAAAGTAVQKFPAEHSFPAYQLLALLGRDDLPGYAAKREAVKGRLDPADDKAELASVVYSLRTAPEPRLEALFAGWTSHGYSDVAMRQLVTATERAGHLEATRGKVRSWLRAKETPGDAWMQAGLWLPGPVLTTDLDAYLAVRHDPAPTFLRINSLDPLRDGRRRRALAAAARETAHPLAGFLDAMYVAESRRQETAAAWQAEMRQHLAAHPDHASCRLQLASDLVDEDPATALTMVDEAAKGGPAELMPSIDLLRAEAMTAEGNAGLAAQALADAEAVSGNDPYVVARAEMFRIEFALAEGDGAAVRQHVAAIDGSDAEARAAALVLQWSDELAARQPITYRADVDAWLAAADVAKLRASSSRSTQSLLLLEGKTDAGTVALAVGPAPSPTLPWVTLLRDAALHGTADPAMIDAVADGTPRYAWATRLARVVRARRAKM